MRISLVVHVMQPVHHLMEVSPRHLLCELPRLSHKIKELAACRIFQDNSKAGLNSALGELIDRVLLDSNEPNQVFVVQLPHYLQLLLQGFKGGGFVLVLLDGHCLPLGIEAQLHSKLRGQYSAE